MKIGQRKTHHQNGYILYISQLFKVLRGSRYRERYPGNVGKQHHVGSDFWTHNQKHGDMFLSSKERINTTTYTNRKMGTTGEVCWANDTWNGVETKLQYPREKGPESATATLSCEWRVADSTWLANLSWSMLWHPIMTLDNAPNDALKGDFTKVLHCHMVEQFGSVRWDHLESNKFNYNILES